jgi:uncharacterized protein involved in response to NO
LQQFRIAGAEPELKKSTRFVLLALGFRPFFLLAALAAIALILAWVLLWHRGFTPDAYYGRVGWHSHEMLFGYATAVVAGFLLTAVRNWTGIDTPTGAPLAALALVWMAGRVLPWWPGLPPVLIALTDLAFLPLLALGLFRSVWAGGNRVNRWFLALIVAMAGANALVHAEALGLAGNLSRAGTYLMADLLVLLVLWVAGRVMPFFTERGIAGAKVRVRPWVERSGFALLLALAATRLAGAPAYVVGTLALALGLLQAFRLAGWHQRGVWGIPILWVLYTALGWLCMGLVLEGIATWGWAPANLAVHALTLGAIGTLTLGMMARVTLGHTGREMRTAPAMTIAFVLINVAALLRVFGPMLWASVYPGWVLLSGICWVVAFVLFALVHGPMLARPRVDGLPG